MTVTDLDPFDLPDWLGGEDVVWESATGLRSSHLVEGVLTSPAGELLGCALLAVDEAYPAPVVTDEVRGRAHQAWHHGQVHTVELDRRLTIAVPGRRFDADLVMETLSRLAMAVGASPDRWAVNLRIGAGRR